VSPTVGEDDLPPGGAMKLAERFEPMMKYAHGLMARVLNIGLRPLVPAAGYIGDTLFKYLPEGDRKVFETPGVKDMLIGDLALSITQGNGLHAMMQDVALFGRDWGFRLADVGVPVSWWHGDDDWCVPLEHGEWCVAKLPDATFHLRPGDSHLSGYAAADDVIDAVAGYLAEGATAAR
jgi:pimeloyl-ACP methyl ester carboxylesterase